MRRFKLQVSTTVDGYMAGLDGKLDWMTHPLTDDVGAYIKARMLFGEPVDCIVLGRKLAEEFIPAWAAGPEGEAQDVIDWMNNTPKVVVSSTLDKSPWENAVVARGDLAETVNRLKAQPGGDLITYGGSRFVSSLIANGLLDELHLFVHPTAIGAGLPVFPKLKAHQRLRLITAQLFECGITALRLEPSNHDELA